MFIAWGSEPDFVDGGKVAPSPEVVTHEARKRSEQAVNIGRVLGTARPNWDHL